MTNSEAIEVLKKNYPDRCYESLRDAVDTAIYALSSQPEQRWIPVTERLPEKESVYVVTFASGAVGLSSMDESYGVIAWMPLPEPYKGGQE